MIAIATDKNTMPREVLLTKLGMPFTMAFYPKQKKFKTFRLLEITTDNDVIPRADLLTRLGMPFRMDF